MKAKRLYCVIIAFTTIGSFFIFTCRSEKLIPLKTGVLRAVSLEESTRTVPFTKKSRTAKEAPAVVSQPPAVKPILTALYKGIGPQNAFIVADLIMALDPAIFNDPFIRDAITKIRRAAKDRAQGDQRPRMVELLTVQKDNILGKLAHTAKLAPPQKGLLPAAPILGGFRPSTQSQVSI
ncbi:MAG: hypothetical protein NTV07_03160 [Candidatus Omnitrophica bacterium]|nr:hypothetical protein [Candidatus Omnitrophota bacterium]